MAAHASSAPLHAVVVAGGAVPARAELDAAWPGWLHPGALVVAADTGWTAALALGLRPSLLVGDLDSIAPGELDAAVAAGVAVERARPAKDETDTELALLAALARGVRDLVIVGGLGGERLDHALANVWLLVHPALVAAGARAVLLDERTRVGLVDAPGPGGGPVERALPGRIGAQVSLLPLGEVAGVTTRDLAFPLRDEALHPGPARGISNARTGAACAVVVRSGRLVIVEGAGPPAGAADGRPGEPAPPAAPDRVRGAAGGLSSDA